MKTIQRGSRLSNEQAVSLVARPSLPLVARSGAGEQQR
jgi:hypothetical protein